MWKKDILLLNGDWPLQGDPSPGEPRLGWLWFWLFHPLPSSACADGKLVELTEQLGKMVEHPKAKSTHSPGHGHPCSDYGPKKTFRRNWHTGGQAYREQRIGRTSCPSRLKYPSRRKRQMAARTELTALGTAAVMLKCLMTGSPLRKLGSAPS